MPGDVAQSGMRREFPMSDADFHTIRKLVHEETGISLAETKRDMVYGRLAKRIRALGMTSFTAYVRLLRDPEGEEMPHLVNAITTNLTFFFREPHHFDFLRQTALPEAIQANRSTGKIRIWSAGCSTGEEPYSIAIVLHEALKGHKFDAQVLATDLDSNVLATASAGVYDLSRLDGLDVAVKKQYFLRRDDKVRVKPVLSPYVQFRQLNLLRDWPMKGLFDVIFCRNVLIYFDGPTQQKLFARFASQLRAGGYLVIGHSETMHPRNERYEYLGKTIYQRCA